MAYDFKVYDISTVDESVRDLYKEQVDNKSGDKYYVMDVNGACSKDDFDKVQKALFSERKIREDYEKKYKSFGDYTPESIREMQEKLTTYEATGTKNNEEMFKKIEEIKTGYQQDALKTKKEYEDQIASIKSELSLRDKTIMGMKLDNALKEAYMAKGEPTMFDAFKLFAASQLEWNNERNEFRTKDSIYDINEWLEKEVYTKRPGFLKSNLSAGARESNSLIGGYESAFDPKSDKFSYAKQIELMKKDPIKADEYLRKYSK